MKVARFASAPDGRSLLVAVDIPSDNASIDAFGNIVYRSTILSAQSAMVTEMPDGLYQDWHPVSWRQLPFVPSGILEIETIHGKKQQCNSGDEFLSEDVGGSRHGSRTIGGPARVQFVHLAPEATLDG